MQELREILRRNRTVILLFTVLVIVPSLLLAYVGFRVIRAGDVQQQFQQRNRQRQIALLLNDACVRIETPMITAEVSSL